MSNQELPTSDGLCAVCGEHANEHLAIPGHQFQASQFPKEEQVRRFACTSGGAQFCQGCYQMEADEYGDYVRFEDYERLAAERDQYEQKLLAAEQLAIRQSNTINKLEKTIDDLNEVIIAAGWP